jgi:prepilin-type processing-associated H-X9-DG protein
MSFRKCVPGILILLGVGFIVSMVYPVVFRARGSEPRGSCISKLKQIGLGVRQYMQDHNERYPLASTPTGGWVDAIYPYLKSTRILQCPTEPMWSLPPETVGELPFDPKRSGITDYYYNARLQGRPDLNLNDIQRTIMFGDGNDGIENTDARYAKSSLPTQWRSDTSSPTYRHLKGANYGFADGHAKWLKANQIKDKGRAGDNYYFWPKMP